MKEGIKFDAEKPRWDLLPLAPMKEVVDVLTIGAAKYAPENWRFVQPFDDRYYAGAMRHITDWRLGEKIDSETNKSHLAHAICCLLFLMEGPAR